MTGILDQRSKAYSHAFTHLLRYKRRHGFVSKAFAEQTLDAWLDRFDVPPIYPVHPGCPPHSDWRALVLQEFSNLGLSQLHS
ncbi:MAG: hypothetical protein ABL901_12655 [Hyphomicrobiaceae bacterium]